MNIIISATGSLFRYSYLVLTGSLHLRKTRIGKLYKIERRGSYLIFRETVSTHKVSETPKILIVGFRLKVLESNPLLHWLFQRVCILTTPFWSGFKGFHIKLWMVDPKTKNYMGIYSWYGRENAQEYVNFLVKILRPLSTRGSVWYKIIEGEPFEDYLKTRLV